MIELVPVESYYDVYINICLILVLVTLLHTRVLKINNPKYLVNINVAGILIFGFLVLYIGLRPISNYFGDTTNYNVDFIKYKNGASIRQVNDYGWHVFMKILAQFMNIHVFFTIVCFLYIYPMYRISKEYFDKYWYFAFIMFVVSFSFWTYGVNGIRNGAACSLFLWGICYHRKKTVMAFFFLVSILFHKTIYLPILAFILTYFLNNPKVYFFAWLACIPLSLVLGGLWITLFANMGFGDDRLSGYLLAANEGNAEVFGGFRWDFLFHSAFAVFAGWYFVFKRNFSDKLYFQLLNTYLICNAFWILVISANYSNRFAYLSWFMMALIIIYPLLKKQFFNRQHAIIGNIIAIYFAFTYLMYYVYYN